MASRAGVGPLVLSTQFTRHLHFISPVVGVLEREREREREMAREEEKMMKRAMVTFDVDGTLIRSVGSSSNRLHRLAFSHAFHQVFGLSDATIDVIQVPDRSLSLQSFSLICTLFGYKLCNDLQKFPKLETFKLSL